jgi:hypothetical protein
MVNVSPSKIKILSSLLICLKLFNQFDNVQ